MKLLVVDDQFRVVEGILRGVRWKKLKIDQVFSALNVFRAKEILEKEHIDILLCDIEMPAQNGLELIRWIKDRGMPVRCIILTAHADFGYAKIALKLGCVDYILQPASYQAIEESVSKAVKQVEESEHKEKLESLGLAYGKRKKEIFRSWFRGCLRGIAGESFRRMPEESEAFWVPRSDQKIWLAMIQLLRWTDIKTWETGLMADTMENIAAEVFETYGQMTVVVPVDPIYFAVFIWGDQEMDGETVFCQLQFISSVYQQFMKCEMAIYIREPEKFGKIAEQWKLLETASEDNVAMNGGVYLERKREQKDHQYQTPELKKWAGLLRDGYAAAVEKEACQYLDSLSRAGTIDRKILRQFYQDFLQVAYHAAESGNSYLKELFSTQEEFQIYLDGMHSVDQMKKLIHYIARNFNCQDPAERPKDLVDKVKNYILDHLDQDMKRDDLAAFVHVHPDYLTRIFKKETGMTLKEFVIRSKMEESKILLTTTLLPVNIIAAKVGYFNFSHFSYTYKKVMGVSPQEERTGGTE